MIANQETLNLSPYMAIYDLVVPKDNMLRQINGLVDFSFVLEELKSKYCHNNGRNAVPPIRMFKYLLLKSIFDLSDVDIVERSKYDMSFKYFHDMAPEASVIDPSSLTKFRKGSRTKEEEFEFNKDAGMYVCKAGHMAIRKARTGKKNLGTNQSQTYYFDICKCKVSPLREGCYKEGVKSQTYSVTIKSTEHKDQEAFQNSEECKSKAKSRYKIEAKNIELKHKRSYDVPASACLFGMKIQRAMTIFTVNLKRVMT